MNNFNLINLLGIKFKQLRYKYFFIISKANLN